MRISMKKYRFPDTPAWRVGLWGFLTVLLLLARDTQYTHVLLGFYKAQILMLAVIAAGVAVFAIYNRRELKAVFLDRRMAAVILFALLILVPMAVKRDMQLMYLSILICLLFAVFLTYFVSMKEVARVYVVVLCVLAVYSVAATYVLRILPDRGIVDVPVVSISSGVELYNFFLSFVSISYVKTRNFGIFREPGVYQFFILIALYLTNYTVEWKKQRSLWLANLILAVTMVTTMATGGLIELVLFAGVLFFDKKMYRDKKIRILAIAAGTVVLVVLVISFAAKNAIYWFIYDILFEKFINRSDSVTERTEAIMVDLQIFLQHPVFGAKIAEVLHAVRNNTTSTLILYAIFGVLGGSLNVVCWIALVWEKERNVIWNLGLLLILFMAFNTQNLTADVFFWLFPVMALCERGLPLLKLPKKG